MNAANRRQIEDLFQQAADLTPEKRGTFLDTACTDRQVREEVDSLLAHLESRRLASLQAADDLDREDAELIGETIGPYKLLELIGEGGFGAVYRAQQERPVRRNVAVKIIKLGMDTKQVIARFEAERQALAMMEHPNIAKVFEAGATESGRPYFAMELVRGVPITEHCDERRSTIRQRLGLFILVCRAVQHAHQKGIIHRDIKPSNVLVTLQDGVPVPKMIDFGIAKAMHQSLTDKTLVTGFRQFIGTPEYVSPEQAEMSPGAPGDIDTRSDIYSLGVLLYELLTGMAPFDPEVLRSTTYSEMQRIICQQEPITPSRRVGTLGAKLRQVATTRRTEPHILRRLLSGDLDWISTKAMDKDRNRRYETAAALADDVRRYLDNEPVSAGPPGVVYRLRKSAARYKTAVGFVLALFAVVSAFGLWMALLYTEAEQERHLAQASLVRAKQAEERAEVEARTARQVASVLAGLYEVADPFREPGGAVTAREMLDTAAEKIRDDLDLRPETQAALMDTMGRVYTNLGIFDRAESLLTRALELRRDNLGPAHPDTISSMNGFGAALMYDNQLSEAESLLRGAMEIAHRTLGEDHPETIAAISSLSWTLQSGGQYAEAEPLCRRALEGYRRTFGDEHPKTLVAINALSWLLQCRSNFAEAETLSREALQTCLRAFGEESVYSAESMNILGGLLLEEYRIVEAEPFIRQAEAIRRRLLGPDHFETLESMANVARLLSRQGRFSEAEVQSRAVLEGYRRLHGDKHRRSLRSMCCVGEVLVGEGRYDEAELLVKEALPQLRRLVGDDHQNTLLCLFQYARILSARGELAEAEAVLRKSLVDARTSLGEYNTLTLLYAAELGRVLQGQGELDEAEESLERAHLGFRDRFGYANDLTAGQLRLQTDVLLAQDKWLEAEVLLRDAWSLMRETLGDDHISTVRTLARLGVICSRQGKLAEAELVLDRTLPKLRQLLGETDRETVYYTGEWLGVLSARNEPDKTEAPLRETLALLHEKLGQNDPTTLRWALRLGEFLLKRGELTEASSLLEETLAALRRELGDQHRDTQRCAYRCFEALSQQGVVGEHEQVFHEMAANLRETLGKEEPVTLRSMLLLARVLRSQGRLPEVETVLREILETSRGERSSTYCASCFIGVPTSLLGECLALQERYEEAEPLLLDGFATIEAGHGKAHETTAKALARIVDFYEAWGKPDDAAEWRAKALTGDGQ